MCEDSDEEVSELDIQLRTWKKLENNMKLTGFREGAAKGKDLTLQDGFNMGYADGFKLGEHIGMHKGIIKCELLINQSKNSRPNVDEDALDITSSEACVLCIQEKKSNTISTEKIPLENVEDLISTQQSHNNEIINTMRKSDINYLEKR